ncbi:hypothetical protein BpHYR1_022607 [Brachionus plicatilis]|uniref:Uncharacterized protein n=1 Tax=Brachionus plicatilis TaxID=10195 RepID=A0A3M7RBI7_BRAPC|nr:hypothetical protein BpHYR1_022607 [Brachionus plicatilis]
MDNNYCIANIVANIVARVVPQVAIFQVFRPKSQVKSKLDLIFFMIKIKSDKTSIQSSRDLDMT